ncbi:MAG: RraA family protein, partial [Acidovorax sp.]
MIGCQILKRQRAVGLELARQFLDVPVANVSDCMSRMTAGGARLRPMHDGTAMAGPAFTIKT